MIEAGRTDEDENYQGEEYEGLVWNENSSAPGGEWGNYIFPARRLVGTGEDGYMRYQTLTEAQINGNEQHEYYVNGSEVSIPGLSTYWAMQNPGRYEYNQVEKTSGIDCSGLAHRIALYGGSSYWVANERGEKYGTGTFANDTNAGLQLRSGGWGLMDNDNLERREEDRKIISKAVPGDMLVYRTEGNGHVVIIQGLDYEEEMQVITGYNQVRIIHSTMGIPTVQTWRVQMNTWDDLGDNKNIYQLRRYR